MSRFDKFFRKAIDTLYANDPELKVGNSPDVIWRTYGALKGLEEYPFLMPEILAPANVSTYKTAINAGATAIYFGYGSLNARATAENFSELKEVVQYCHARGVKAYLTLNIMMKDVELNEARRIILEAEEAKIDAFIISDMALVNLIRRNSSAAIHASTQMGVHNVAGALLLQNLGFNRVVLSREVTKEDLDIILDKTEIEVEVFVHGALCVGFSGTCLFSAILTGKSGNRGRCTQLCRRYYSCLMNGKQEAQGYLLSAKDNCMADRYRELFALNVDSLKIEGRLRGEEYVSTVTQIYSEIEKGVSFDREKEDDLKIAFNRGNFTHGYWDTQDVIFPYFPNHIGLRCGRVMKILSKNLVAVLSTRPLLAGDFLKVSRGTEEIGGLEVTGEKKIFDGKETFVCHNPNNGVQVGDVVAITKRKVELPEPRRVPIEIAVRIIGDAEIRIVATCENVMYDYTGQKAPVAINAPIEEKDVINAFQKTGDSEFEFLFIEILTSNAFLTKKELNEMRREVLAYFHRERIEGYKREYRKKTVVMKPCERIEGDFAEFEELGQVVPAVTERVANIVYSPRSYDYNEAKAFYRAVKDEKHTVLIKFPMFIPENKTAYAKALLEEFDGAFAQNLGVIGLCLEMNKPYVVGWALNVANTKNPLLKWGAQTVLSVELKSSEINKINEMFYDRLPVLYAFGKLPLMYLTFCPKRLVGRSCADCKEEDAVCYRDQKGEYAIYSKKFDGYCQQEYRNSILTNIGRSLKNPLYFDFCGFDAVAIDRFFTDYYVKNRDVTGYNHLLMQKGVE